MRTIKRNFGRRARKSVEELTVFFAGKETRATQSAAADFVDSISREFKVSGSDVEDYSDESVDGGPFWFAAVDIEVGPNDGEAINAFLKDYDREIKPDGVQIDTVDTMISGVNYKPM